MSRILFIDAYDSFSNNIIALLKEQLHVSVHDIKIDDSRFVLNDEAFFDFLHGFDAVVAGPGPGHPANPPDIGLISKLWTLPDAHLLPTLGICLGFQSLALTFGASIERLPEPRHGRVTSIEHCNSGIFETAGTCVVTQYHSLHAILDDNPAGAYTASHNSPDLVPLAWDKTGVRPILMGLQHCNKPFRGVQFHPESVCTNPSGGSIIRNWWSQVLDWRANEMPKLRPDDHALTTSSSASSVSELQTPEDEASLPGPKTHTQSAESRVNWTSMPLPSGFSISSLMSLLTTDRNPAPVLLESGTRNGHPVNPETGRYSIIGLGAADALAIQYYTCNNTLSVSRNNIVEHSQAASMSEVFNELDDNITQHRAYGGSQDVPFWGGLVGYIAYEAGLETIGVAPMGSTPAKPDVWFLMIERSIVVDHVENVVYIQTLRSNDTAWMHSAASHLLNICKEKLPSETLYASEILLEPKGEEYRTKVETCQAHLRAGSSYELCLTDQTTIFNSQDHWDLYLKLREVNPAPFGAFLDFQRINAPSLRFAGSSPERFLSWDRRGTCQFRPIKGTVKKSTDMSRQRAEEILNSEKEQAENLMIVDLIRHDLNGVPCVREVRVPKLMSVEEYETVYQLVSVIEGDVTPPARGIAALARSLPPGSMTGAPKKRSCELLSHIEGHGRGLYSGVLGYLDVGGGGDFSVVIRSAFKWSDDNVWRIGAGGAITALSEPEAEWEEMLAKRERLLSVFN